MKILADWAYLAVEKHFKKVLKHEVGVLENKDIEELHQMRVGMRRLRSTIDGLAIVLQLPKGAETAKVGKIARVLGKLRDLDVMNETLQGFTSIVPEQETIQLEYALKMLSKERKRAFKQVKITLSNCDYLNLKEAFRDWLETPVYSEISQLDISTILPDLLLPQVSRFLLYPTWYLPTGSLDNPEYLSKYGEYFHSLRKEAKRLRYNLELFAENSSDSYQNYLQEVRDIQAILGEVQDSFVLADFLADIFEVEIEKIIPTLANILHRNRLERWQQWQDKQMKFLSPKFRREFYQSCMSVESSPEMTVI